MNSEEMVTLGKRSTANEFASIFLEAAPHDMFWNGWKVYDVILKCLIDSAHKNPPSDPSWKVLKMNQRYSNATDEVTKDAMLNGMCGFVEMMLGVENPDCHNRIFMIPPKVHVTTVQVVNTLKHYARTGDVDWSAEGEPR